MRFFQTLLIVVGIAAGVLVAGCSSLAEMEPHPVAAGVARLSVRNIGTALQAVSSDSTCGFASPSVMASALVQGADAGSVGQVQWRVQNCRIDFGDQTQLPTDCRGNSMNASGAVLVSGTKTVTGVLTGDPNNPVIPQNPDAVTFELTTKFQNFQVDDPNAQPQASLKWESGSMTFTAQPHLAVSQANQVCAVATPNLTVSSAQYAAGSKVLLTTRDQNQNTNKYDVNVDNSSFEAQVGAFGKQENSIQGWMTVWGNTVSVPNDGQGLDPNYNAQQFLNSYSCTKDLALPVSFSCPSVQSLEGQAASRLGISALGNLAIYIDSDTTCGFANSTILANPQLTGDLGENDGSVTYTMPTCTLHFPNKTVIAKDCLNNEIVVQGDLTVSGTKTVYGINTGSLSTPVVPTSWEPADYNLRFDFSNFYFSDHENRSVSFATGTVTGEIKPRTAQDTTTGACTLSTPVAYFDRVNLQNATMSIQQGTTSLSMFINNTALTAQSGTGGQYTNYLGGSVTVNGSTLALPTGAGQNTLDSDYNEGTFIASYSCKANQRIPSTTADCNMKQTLGENMSRLLVQDAATAAKLAAVDTSCGFDFTYGYNGQLLPDSVLQNPTNVTGNSGSPGSMTFQVNACELVQGKLAQLPPDCLGNVMYLQGSVKASGSAKVNGNLYKVLDFYNAVYPTTYTSTDMSLSNLTLSEFSAYQQSPGSITVPNQLIIHSGQLQEAVVPISGERASKPDHYDVATPVAWLPSITLSNAKATMVLKGMTFNLTIPSAQIQAFNGTYGGQSNFVEGQVTLGTDTVAFQPIPLNPDFNQATFDQSYACTNDLMSVISSH